MIALFALSIDGCWINDVLNCFQIQVCGLLDITDVVDELMGCVLIVEMYFTVIDFPDCVRIFQQSQVVGDKKH